MNIREYMEKLIQANEPIDYRGIAKMFDSSYPAVKDLEYIILTGKPYYQKTKGMAIASVNNNRARRLSVPGTVTRDEWLAVCESHGNICAYCKQEVPLTMDHIIPLSRGGTHTTGNIQPLCKPCNSRKGSKTDSEARAANANKPPKPGKRPRGRPRKKQVSNC